MDNNLMSKLNECSTASEMLNVILNNTPIEILDKKMGFITKQVFISGLIKAVSMIKLSK
jgi:hypothetical protein